MSSKPSLQKPATEVSSSGITTNALTGERHIPPSLRPDGSQRREIKIRPGYRPPEDIQVYKNRTAEAWKNRGKIPGGGVPGAEGLRDESKQTATAAATAAANKNAKKREAKKRARAAEGDAGAGVKQEGGVAAGGKAIEKENWREGKGKTATAAGDAVEVDPEAEKEKKARNLRKKLRQARELSEKKENGENLLPEQFEKVIKIQELVRQLDALGFDSEGERKKEGP
ncbi:hypothetical protein AJ79_06396 [Helicocarpus griseus UAMH5409]|uniref:WIBG Mago-binding domain-containing protein n=1 Tax=Helicocarpus griseus UAMH5409 TaxID=1447875 RepID=A0A2B7XDV0_9EURO|nr:hypothetical protein AJ79_06396 [Helicocarpus griseus UAMH5409]